MNIGQGIYPILSQKQANPFASSLQNVLQQHLANMQMKSQTQGMNLQNQLAQKLMPTQVSQAQQSLQSSTLANQRAQALLPYVVPDAQADLQGKQLGNTSQSLQNILAKALMPSQIQGAQDQNKLTEAQADYYQNGGAQGGAGGVGMGLINGLQRQIKTENPSWSPDQVSNAASAYLQGATTLPDGTQLPPPSGLVSSIADQINLKGNTSMGTNQQRFAATLDTAFQAAQPLADNAFKYAGAEGQAKLAADKLAAQNGHASPQYADYLKFTRQTIPTLASEILRTGGANSTDTQKTLAINQLNPIAYDTNPALAKEQWDYLNDLYKQIGKALSQSVTQTKGQLRTGSTGSYGDSSNNDYSSSASSSSAPSKVVAALMKKHGLTQEEAEELIGGNNG